MRLAAGDVRAYEAIHGACTAVVDNELEFVYWSAVVLGSGRSLDAVAASAGWAAGTKVAVDDVVVVDVAAAMVTVVVVSTQAPHTRAASRLALSDQPAGYVVLMNPPPACHMQIWVHYQHSVVFSAADVRVAVRVEQASGFDDDAADMLLAAGLGSASKCLCPQDSLYSKWARRTTTEWEAFVGPGILNVAVTSRLSLLYQRLRS